VPDEAVGSDAGERSRGGGGGSPGGVGELWLAGPASIVDTGAGARSTLDEIAAAAGAPFLGERPMRLLGPRFPLLMKLIDAGDWLSLQVHPDDELAAELYGPRSLGKTEAWLVLDADPGTTLVTGPRAGLTEAELRTGIRAGTLGHAECEARPAVPGDVLLIEAGTIHAIGLGAFVYEIEQPSDLTFRISDWGRPPVPGRSLHREESLRAVRAEAHAILSGTRWRLDGGALSVREFRFEIERPATRVTRRPGGRSLEVVTAGTGPLTVTGDGWSEDLRTWETLVVPASVDAYGIDGPADSLALIGSVP
jgi:mannose-6-phosphate isomerase